MYYILSIPILLGEFLCAIIELVVKALGVILLVGQKGISWLWTIVEEAHDWLIMKENRNRSLRRDTDIG